MHVGVVVLRTAVVTTSKCRVTFFGFCFILFYFILFYFAKLQFMLNNSFAFHSFRIQAILVGQGQWPVAEKIITNATKTGEWVFLQVRKGIKLIREFVWG